MKSTNSLKIIDQKGLSKRQKNFVKKLAEKGGNFTNKDLAKIWGANALPSKFKKKLIEDPSILVMVQQSPQKYKLTITKHSFNQQSSLSNSILPKATVSKISPTFISNDFKTHFSQLEKRIEFLEQKVNELLSPYRKITLKEFKNHLIKDYQYLNPSSDISGVSLETLKRRSCRELKISPEYFEDLIFDLRKKESIISIQSGRGAKYIHIKI